MEQLRISQMISQDKINQRVNELGAELTQKFKPLIQADSKPGSITALCILKGSFMFFSDLVRAVNLDLHCDFFGVASYHNSTKSSGEVKLTLDLSQSIEGKHVVLVEDIVDTGLTMNYLIQSLEARKPKSLTTVSLLLKPDALKVKTQLDFVGFEIPNEFVVGYGLDYQGFYRNLPYIGRVDSLN